MSAAPAPRWHGFDDVLAALPGLPLQAPPDEARALARALDHCAQGIGFSMSGFPRPRPAWFRASVGPLVFALFRLKGRMSHDLAAPIPGERPHDPAEDPAAALQRLRGAITAFGAWTGPWAPHFTYGHLDRAGHERAHTLHLADHLKGWLPAD